MIPHSFQNQVIANQLKRQNDELIKLRESLEAKNVSELKLQVQQGFFFVVVTIAVVSWFLLLLQFL